MYQIDVFARTGLAAVWSGVSKAARARAGIRRERDEQ